MISIKAIPVWFFPSILIALDVLAALIFLFQKDFRRSVYWFSAAILTVTVTF